MLANGTILVSLVMENSLIRARMVSKEAIFHSSLVDVEYSDICCGQRAHDVACVPVMNLVMILTTLNRSECKV